MRSTTLPGATHRWTGLPAFADEGSTARIRAGFHYRTSARVAAALGRDVGNWVAGHALLPLR